MALSLIIAVLLLCVNVFIAVTLAKGFDIKNKIKRLYELSENSYQARKLSGKSIGGAMYGKSMGFTEKLELMLIEKSNIRHYIPFMNIYILIAISAVIFLVAYGPVARALDFLPTALVVSGIISMTPFFALELLARYNSESIRKRLSEYISVLNRWCSVKEDIMYAFEKSLGSNIGEPLKTFIQDMVIQVNRGMNASDALDMLQMKVDNPQFRDFIINVKQSLKHRGDVVKLLTNLENQFYKIDEEYNRRRISTYKDRLLIYFIMAGVLVTAYLFICSSPQIEDFYLRTAQGKVLMLVFSIMYVFGFCITAGITRFRY